MRAKAYFLAILAVFPFGVLAGGCSDDPPPAKPFGPGSTQSDPGTQQGGPSPGTTSTTGSSGGVADASVDRDPGYRDPNQIDAGCTAPNRVCNGKCVAVGSDPDNCGQCGTQCAGPGAVCNAGSCGCTGPLFEYCAGTGCMDVSGDFNNCGACGKACDPNNDQSCTAGVCIPN